MLAFLYSKVVEMANTSLTERVLMKIITNREECAVEYMGQYLKYGNVRYAAYSKTKPLGLVFYSTKNTDEKRRLTREAGKQAIVLVGTGNERLGHVRALISKNNDVNYEVANQCIYHIEPEDNVLCVDGIQTNKNFRQIGVGSSVISFIKDIAIASGCTKVVLDSVPTAVSFYKKMGFQVAGAQVCNRGTLTTMEWGVSGEFNTTKFTVNELNLMMQRGAQTSKNLFK